MTGTPSDALLKKILGETRTIACVGMSLNPIRPSYFVGRHLHGLNGPKLHIWTS